MNPEEQRLTEMLHRVTPEPPRRVNAIGRFGKRAFSDVQKVKACTSIAPGIPFNDVCGD